MILKTLALRFTRDRLNKPLVIIDSEIGNGFEASPDEVRKIAAALMRAADDADRRASAPYLITATRHYDI